MKEAAFITGFIKRECLLMTWPDVCYHVYITTYLSINPSQIKKKKDTHWFMNLLLRLYSGCTHDILFTLFTSRSANPAYWTNCICVHCLGGDSCLCPVIDHHTKKRWRWWGGGLLVLTSWNTGRWTESIVMRIKRGQTHNRGIIRTRPLCMNPSTSTQLCQTAWSIIFSNSWGLESYYGAPSVTQTSVPKQVTSWLFTPGFDK